MAKKKRERGPSGFLKFATEMIYGPKPKEAKKVVVKVKSAEPKTKRVEHETLASSSDPFNLGSLTPVDIFGLLGESHKKRKR